MKNLQYIISFLFVFLTCCIGQIPAQAFQKLIYNQEKDVGFERYALGPGGEIACINHDRMGRDVLLLLDENGSPLWAKEFEIDSFNLRMEHVVFTKDGDIVVAAIYTVPWQNPTLGYDYTILMRFSPEGELRWKRRIGKIDDVYIFGRRFSICNLYSIGNAIVAQTPENTLYNLLLIRIEKDGDLLWAKSYDINNTNPYEECNIYSPQKVIFNEDELTFTIVHPLGIGSFSSEEFNRCFYLAKFSFETGDIILEKDFDFNSNYRDFSHWTFREKVSESADGLYINTFELQPDLNYGVNLFWRLDENLNISYLHESNKINGADILLLNVVEENFNRPGLLFAYNDSLCHNIRALGYLHYNEELDFQSAQVMHFWPYSVDDWHTELLKGTSGDAHILAPVSQGEEKYLGYVNLERLSSTGCDINESTLENFTSLEASDSTRNPQYPSRNETNMEVIDFPVSINNIEFFEEEYCIDCHNRFTLQNQLIPSDCEAEPVVTIIPSVFGGAGPYDFYWTSEAGTFSDSLLIDVPPGYYVLTIEDRICCDTTIVIDATAASLLTVVINSDTDTACYGEIVQLSSVSPPFTTPIWNTGDAGLETEVTVLTDTVITAEVVSGNCLLRDSFHLYAWPELVVEAGPDTTVPYGQTVQLFATGGTVYQWSGGELSCIACPDPQTTIFEDTEFTVEITDANGCSAVDTISIRVSDIRIYIPNVFSPNGDGINDQFQVFAPELARFRMRIFSRWGDLVFGTEDQHFQWDGNLKEAMLPAGVYTYHIVANTYSGETIERVGDLTLVR